MPELYLLGMVLALVKAKLWPAEAAASRARAADQLLRAGYKLATAKMRGAKGLRRSVSDRLHTL